MLDLSRYESLGAALRDAMERWADEVCLVEDDRGKEKARFTYRDFRAAGLPLAKALQESGFGAGSRASIIMTNQSKWLISAYAIFHSGGVLVPLDFKLTAPEQIALLKHSQAGVLITEYFLWRNIVQAGGLGDTNVKLVLVTEAPPNADLVGAHSASSGEAQRWEEFKAAGAPTFVPRQRSDWASIVYSSGTGGRPKGCVMTHENYLEQCIALTAWYPFWPGVRYLSILPTNHAIDFMVGFIGPFTCGACVVHLRTLRPEFVREAFARHRITYVSLVPLVVKNLEKGLRERFVQLPATKRLALNALVALNRALTRKRPNPALSRRLLPQVHEAFGGELRAMIVGGAFAAASTLQFLYDLGIPVVNGYGLTEAGTAVTVNDLRPFRADTVGKPLPGMEVKIVGADSDGIGEVAVRSRTVMSHYLDDPELTAETLRNGWLMTGDLGRLDPTGHLQLFGRRKNMIVTEGGKNVYAEDVENAFEGLPVKEFCVFAANYLWPQKQLGSEQLVMVLHAEPGQSVGDVVVRELATRNRRLLDFKRLGGYLVWEEDFPRTASLKIKRELLAGQIRQRLDRGALQPL